MKVRAVSVKCFELFTPQGESLGLFRVADQWRGMQELKAVGDDRATIIVHDLPGNRQVFDEVFGDIFGKERGEYEVVRVAPSLAVKLAKEQPTENGA